MGAARRTVRVEMEDNTTTIALPYPLCGLFTLRKLNYLSQLEVPKMATKKVGRDAGSGKFIPVKEAERRKKTAVVETIKTSKKK